MPHETDPTRSLVDRASHNDGSAMGALLERHLTSLRAYVRLKAGEHVRASESVSDLVQSVCREALEEVGTYRYRSEAAFRHWLFTLALRKIIDRGRRDARLKRRGAVPVALPTGSSDDGAAAILDCYATFCTPSRVAMAKEETERIERAVDRLPDDYREIITLSRVVGLSHAEIGEILGRSEDASKHLLARALARLSTLLKRD